MTEAGIVLLSVGVFLVVIGLGAGRVVGRVLGTFGLDKWQIDYAVPWLRAVPIILGAILIFAAAGPPTLQAVKNALETNPNQVQVTVPEGAATTVAYGGPSIHAPYPRRGIIQAGTKVQVICTTYGEPLTFGTTTQRLWNFTDKGWINDHFVDTKGTGPTAPACTGSIAKPVAGTTTPTQKIGPFAVVAREGGVVNVYANAAMGSPITTLPGGTFVVLTCSVSEGAVVPAPRGYELSNNDWDKIVPQSNWDHSREYWIPDSYVASYSSESTAPAC